MNDNDEPHLWEFDEAMRFISPCTYHQVHHDDGDVTLEGHACTVEVHDGWFTDAKRRIDALNRAGISTATLGRRLAWMHQATDEAALRSGWEVFEATLEGLMDDLLDALDAQYDDED